MGERRRRGAGKRTEAGGAAVRSGNLVRVREQREGNLSSLVNILRLAAQKSETTSAQKLETMSDI